MSNIILGAKYQDKITGFSGVATGHVEYISGCNQTLLVPRVGDDGKLLGGEWFDDQRLEHIPGKVVHLDNGATPGFDMAAPVR